MVAGGGLRVSRSHPGSRNGVCLLQGGQAVGGPGAVVGKGAAGGGGGDSGRVIAGLGALAVLVWKVESVFFFFSIFYFLAPLSLSRGAPPCRRVSAFSILYLNQPLMSRLSGRASDMGGSGGWGMAGGRGGVLAAEGRVRATDGGVKK